MATVITFKQSLNALRQLRDTTTTEMQTCIDTLGKHTKSLNDEKAKTFSEVKDSLKKMTKEMLSYFPTIETARTAGQKAIAEVQKAVTLFTSTGRFTEDNIKHMELHGYKRERIVSLESDLKKADEEFITMNNAFSDLVKKIDELEVPFKTALDSTLKIIGENEGTNTWSDAFYGVARFVYLEKALEGLKITSAQAEPAKPTTTYADALAKATT